MSIRRLFLVCLLAASGWAQTATYSQGCVASASDLTANCTVTVTSGHLYVASSKTQASSAATPTFSSSGVTCTWVQAVAPIQQDILFTSALSSCLPASSGSMTITATWAGGAAAFTDIAVGDYSTTGTWVNPVLDQGASSSNGDNPFCGTGTTSATSNATDLVIGVCNNFSVGQTWGALSGWTNEAASSRNTVGWYDQNVSSTGTQNTTIPFTSSDSSTGMIAAFKMTSGGGATVPAKLSGKTALSGKAKVQ